MVEKGKNGFSPREFVEVDSNVLTGMAFIFSSDLDEARKREDNRKRIESEQGLGMKGPLGAGEALKAISNSGTEGGVRRRRSAGARHIIKGR